MSAFCTKERENCAVSRTMIGTIPAPFTIESPNSAHPSWPAAPNDRRPLASVRIFSLNKLAFAGRYVKMHSCFFSVKVRSKSGVPPVGAPKQCLI